MVNSITAAFQRISPHILYTPLEFSSFLEKETGVAPYLKLENYQHSGSFKIRGVMNKMLTFPESERPKQFFVAASTGNHAGAFVYALQKFGLKGKVFLPTTVSKAKLDFIQSFGVPFKLHGEDCLDTEIFARHQAEENGYIFISPYNDLDVIAGQGTIGYELWQQLPDLDAVIVPVGGGGLISGIASYLKTLKLAIRVFGCQPEKSPEMYESMRKGRIIEESITQPTLSDATAGGMEPGAVTFDLCRAYVDEITLVTEEQIKEAIVWSIKYHQMVIEGSAALAIATLRQKQSILKGKKVVLIMCGKRLSYDKLISLF